ncbi:hypothetical protein ACWGNF_16385 [Streptomyces sp. NPDC055808]|uniref:hypothetical protein n=1 Tax=Streptomyces sp. NPDC001828 TaxID=3364615 RepID=UPI003678F643
MAAQAAGAPSARRAPYRFPLRLDTVVHREFPAGNVRIDDAFSRRHFADLTALYGVEARPEVADGPAGNTFADMAAALLADLTDEPADIGLAVVAHTTPDLDCRRAAVTCLSEVIPGRPLVFTVADCGSAAPFVALEAAGAYIERHGHRAAAVFVLDQATLPYRTGRYLAGDAGAALLFTPTGRAGSLTVRRTSGVAADDVPAAVRASLDELGCDPEVPAVLSPGLRAARDLPGHRGPTVSAPDGFPVSGVLGALAAEIGCAAPGRESRRVVVDHDPDTAELSVCLLDQGAP